MLYDVIHNYVAILKKNAIRRRACEHSSCVYARRCFSGQTWLWLFLSFAVSFLPKCNCVSLKVFFHLWTDNVQTQWFSQTHCACTSLSAMWYGLITTSVGACGVGAPSSHWFSPENLLLGSLSCQHAVGWPVHTWTFPLVPPPWCSSRTIILLWRWQSQLTLCARDTE